MIELREAIERLLHHLGFVQLRPNPRGAGVALEQEDGSVPAVEGLAKIFHEEGLQNQQRGAAGDGLKKALDDIGPGGDLLHVVGLHQEIDQHLGQIVLALGVERGPDGREEVNPNLGGEGIVSVGQKRHAGGQVLALLAPQRGEELLVAFHGLLDFSQLRVLLLHAVARGLEILGEEGNSLDLGDVGTSGEEGVRVNNGQEDGSCLFNPK